MDLLGANETTREYCNDEIPDSEFCLSSVPDIAWEDISTYNSRIVNATKIEDCFETEKKLKAELENENFVDIELELPVSLGNILKYNTAALGSPLALQKNVKDGLKRQEFLQVGEQFQFTLGGLLNNSDIINVPKVDKNCVKENIKVELTKDKCVQVREQELHFTLKDLLKSNSLIPNKTKTEQRRSEIEENIRGGLKRDKFVQVEEQEIRFTLGDLLGTSDDMGENFAKMEDQELQLVSEDVLRGDGDVINFTEVEENCTEFDKNLQADVKPEYLMEIEEQELHIKDESEIEIGQNSSDSSFDNPLLSQPEVTCVMESGTRKYKCSVCSYRARFRCRIKEHILKHKKPSEVEMFKCKICEHRTKYKSLIKKHMMIHKKASEVTMHGCNLCAFETKHKSTLLKHALTHKDTSEIEMYKCGVCLFETRYKHGLIAHMLLHKNRSELRMFKCKLCTFESMHKRGFKLHLLSHKSRAEVTMYKCKECSFESKYKNSISTHMLIHKDPSEINFYKCEKCSFETKYKRSISMHLSTHK